MPVDNFERRAANAQLEAARTARRIVRQTLKASLATIDHRAGHPYVSLILLATEPDATPIFLISRLARHTQNLEMDARASLLVDGTHGLADPMIGARVTILGEGRRMMSPTLRRRFLARHPTADAYVDFADFSFFAFTAHEAHLVAGFGQIVDLAAASLHTETSAAELLIEAEAELVLRMNSEQAELLARCGMAVTARSGPWRLSGVDPEGCDLVMGGLSARLDFPHPVGTPECANNALLEIVSRFGRDASPNVG
jgi:putative heme iron utilization protein